MDLVAEEAAHFLAEEVIPQRAGVTVRGDQLPTRVVEVQDFLPEVVGGTLSGLCLSDVRCWHLIGHGLGYRNGRVGLRQTERLEWIRDWVPAERRG